ncbi:DUF1217 domain-containing protein [Salipiger mucosus]|uniref:Flagellar basal-body rod protein FlgF n=1 Tax=Salipiger mucosus DSM 16094 TaxID=1123237 RepID=S9QEM8_9RHOB|nr:DUF1217 domain-containing protein [Salipiger mucosus]EPX78018.1 Flagellar basal-body rod protein FlgF [Salipiger mucosus DSM 16094]
MINIGGLSTPMAMKVIDDTKDKQLEGIRNEVVHKRAIEDFRKNAPDIESIDDFVENYETFSFMMKAHGLEDKIYAKGMMKKIFESDINDENSLVRRLNDPKITELYKTMDFQAGGETNYNTLSSQWRQEQVDKYVEREFIDDSADQNSTLGVVLEFEKKAPEIDSWYKILADEDFGDFMRTVLNIPDNVVRLDVDKQKEMFEDAYDIEKLQEPGEIDRLTEKYALIKDIENPPQSAAGNSPILQLMNPSVGFGGGGFTAMTYDIGAISGFSGSSIYR